MHALTVTPFADLMPAPVAPAPRFRTFTAHLLVLGFPYTLILSTEAEFLDVADSFDACVIELYECGSMVLRQCPPVPDLVSGVYPLPLAA
jgi:hypothetical protein